MSGKKDIYPEHGQFKTSAMAEGAIEDTAEDYEMRDAFAVDFKYSRFDARSAKPREIPAFAWKAPQSASSGAETIDFTNDADN